MDKHGIEMMILSLNAPAIQAIHDVKSAIAVAKQANDVLASEVRKRPDRFAAFAALPMQDPEPQSPNSHVASGSWAWSARWSTDFRKSVTPDNVAYLRPKAILAGSGERCEELDVPFYLHPRNPLPSWTKLYEGHNWLLGPTWALRRKPRCMRCALSAAAFSMSVRS